MKSFDDILKIGFILGIVVLIAIVVFRLSSAPNNQPFIPHEVGIGYDMPGENVSFAITKKVVTYVYSSSSPQSVTDRIDYETVRVVATSTPNTKLFQFTPLQSDYGYNRYIMIDCVPVYSDCPTLYLKLNY